MNSIRTRLTGGGRPHKEDERVLATIAKLPSANGTQGLPQRAAVANEEGQIYRHIVVPTAFQLLILTARLNAIGFAVSSELREARRGQYECVFVKRPSVARRATA